MRLSIALTSFFFCLIGASAVFAQVAIDPSGSVTLGTANVNPPTTTKINGRLTVNSNPIGVVAWDFKNGQTATATCPGGTRIVSGGGFYIVPDNKGGINNEQGLCGWGAVMCPIGQTTCSVNPSVSQGCYSPDKGGSIALVQVVCQ